MNITEVKKTADWSRLSETKRNGIMQSLYERSTKMRLSDYMNSLLVCREWRWSLLNEQRISTLKYIRQISTPLFKRFILKASKIDQSDIPKFYIEFILGQNPFSIMAVPYNNPATQEEYEIRELEEARFKSINTIVYATDNNAMQFSELGDEERNNFITKIKTIANGPQVMECDISTRTIQFLFDTYSEIVKNCPEIENEILDRDIFPKLIKYNKTGSLTLFIGVCLFILALLLILALGQLN